MGWWKHIPSKNSLYQTLSDGDKLRIRRGVGIQGEVTIEVVSHDNNRKIVWGTFTGKDGSSVRKAIHNSHNTKATINHVRNAFWDKVDAAAIDILVETAKEHVKDVGKLILKHKSHYTPKVGDVLLLEPHTDSQNRDSYAAEVVKGEQEDSLVLVYTNLRTNCRYRWVGLTKVDKVPLFGKHFLYINTGGSNLTSEEVETFNKAMKSIAEKPVEEEDRPGEYIIWCPTSNKPPRVVLKTEKQARAVAHSMAERHGGKFFWARLNGSVERKKHVKVTYENVVTRL